MKKNVLLLVLMTLMIAFSADARWFRVPRAPKPPRVSRVRRIPDEVKGGIASGLRRAHDQANNRDYPYYTDSVAYTEADSTALAVAEAEAQIKAGEVIEVEGASAGFKVDYKQTITYIMGASRLSSSFSPYSRD